MKNKEVKRCLFCNKKLSTTSQYRSTTKYCEVHKHKARIKIDYKMYLKELNNLPKSFISWLVGFYEGEGNVGTAKKRMIYFQITQKDISPLKIIKKTLKIGKIKLEKRNNSFIHRYLINRSGYIFALLETFIPFMKSIIKIKQVKKILHQKYA